MVGNTSHLPMVKVLVKQESTVALLDTGAQYCFVAQHLVEKLQLSTYRPSKIISGTFANGMLWEATRIVRITVTLVDTGETVKSQVIELEALIIPQLSMDMIIGSDAIRRYQLLPWIQRALEGEPESLEDEVPEIFDDLKDNS